MEKINIYQTIKEINEITYGDMYIEKYNVLIRHYSSSISFINLENAYTKKPCIVFSLNSQNNELAIKYLYEFLDDLSLEDFLLNIQNNIYLEKKELLEKNFNFIKFGETKKIFSPFKKIKEIKIPEKWTIPHIWKAILSGQVEKVICSGEYSDDYSFDASRNFNKGEKDKFSFAKELIESPSGWHTYKSNNKIHVNCHSFDYNEIILK